MSRSRKKPIIKDKPKNTKASTYYRRVRRAINQAVKSGKEIIPNSREVVNDYDYCDYIIDAREYNKDDKFRIKASRK